MVFFLFWIIEFIAVSRQGGQIYDPSDMKLFLLRIQTFIFQIQHRDVPVVPDRFGRLWFGDGPRSGRSAASCCLFCRRPALHGPPPLYGPPPLHGRPPLRPAAGGRVLGGDAGFRAAGAQLPVVLVLYIQQLPWTEAHTEGMDVREERLRGQSDIQATLFFDF